MEPLFFPPGNTMKGFFVLTSFRRCVLSWLATLNLDRGNDRSFDIYYHNFPMGTYLKHFINAYRCVCWMKSTSIDGLDVPYIRPWPDTTIILIVTDNIILSLLLLLLLRSLSLTFCYYYQCALFFYCLEPKMALCFFCVISTLFV